MIHIRSRLNKNEAPTNYKLLAVCSIAYGFIVAGLFYKNTTQEQFIIGTFLTAFLSFIGYIIGKFMRNYVGDAYLSSKGSVETAFKDKLNHQYGAQVKGFLYGGLPYVIYAGWFLAK